MVQIWNSTSNWVSKWDSRTIRVQKWDMMSNWVQKWGSTTDRVQLMNSMSDWVQKWDNRSNCVKSRTVGEIGYKNGTVSQLESKC